MMKFVLGMIAGGFIIGTGMLPRTIQEWDIAEAKRRIELSYILGPCGPNKDYPKLFSELYQDQMHDLIAAYRIGTISSEWWDVPSGRQRFRELMANAGADFVAKCKEFEGKNK